MSGLALMMDRSATPTLMLLSVFLLVSTNIICLQGNSITGDHSLHCVNDYLFTIKCTLSIAPSENTSDSNSSYWLTFTEMIEKYTFNCMLINTNGHYFCSFNTTGYLTPDELDDASIFMDTDIYEIVLHKQTNGTKTHKVLDAKYSPSKNIKPNAPCCLNINHNTRQYHFIWKSTYEEFSDYTALVNNFEYQLNCFTGEEKHIGINGLRPLDINVGTTNISVDDDKFVPDTEYTARVRTKPYGSLFKGQWSDWSSEIQWKTVSVITDSPINSFGFDLLIKVFIPLCVIVPLVLLLCYAPVKKWKQGAFIPTPAPYFDTLYSDCQGDFKSWVITQENTTDMLKTEATLQIDTLTKCTDVLEEDHQPQFPHQFTEGSSYTNITNMDYNTDLLGIPYAVSTMAPLSAPESSGKRLTLTSQPGSPAEGDSGCWLCSDTSLEKDSPWYCNEYCTLSSFQQTSLGTAEHHRSLSIKSYPPGIIRMDATREVEDVCL